MIKVYSEIKNYKPEHRFLLNNIIKALWNDRTPEERINIYGAWVNNYMYEEDISRANICLLTMHWNYYVDHRLLDLAKEEIENANRHHKPIVIFSLGDYPANIPYPNVILFESGGYRSKAGLTYHSGSPFFLKITCSYTAAARSN